MRAIHYFFWQSKEWININKAQVAFASLISSCTSASFFATTLVEWTLFRATPYRLVQQSCQSKNYWFKSTDCFLKNIPGRLRLPSGIRTLKKSCSHLQTQFNLVLLLICWNTSAMRTYKKHRITPNADWNSLNNQTDAKNLVWPNVIQELGLWIQFLLKYNEYKLTTQSTFDIYETALSCSYIFQCSTLSNLLTCAELSFE